MADARDWAAYEESHIILARHARKVRFLLKIMELCTQMELRQKVHLALSRVKTRSTVFHSVPTSPLPATVWCTTARQYLQLKIVSMSVNLPAITTPLLVSAAPAVALASTLALPGHTAPISILKGQSPFQHSLLS